MPLRKSIGHIQTVTGAGGGVILHHQSRSHGFKHDRRPAVTNFQKTLTVSCPGSYIYLVLICSIPAILILGASLPELYGPKIDTVMTVTAKRWYSANAVANNLNVPFVIVRRDLKITEGSTIASTMFTRFQLVDHVRKYPFQKRSLKANGRLDRGPTRERRRFGQQDECPSCVSLIQGWLVFTIFTRQYLRRT